MKAKVLLIVTTVFVSFTFLMDMQSAVPNQLTYTGSIRSYGQPISGTKSLTFSIYPAETGGVASWSSGPVDVKISSGTFTYDLTPNIDWRCKDFWLELVVGDKILSPRTKLTAQAYAFHARTSEDIEKSTGNSIYFVIGTSTYAIISSAGNVGIGTTNPQYVLDVSGTARFTQPITVADPTSNSHAATKQYVDSAITGAGVWSESGTSIYRSVGNVGIGITNPQYSLDVSSSARFSMPIVIPAPTANMHAATKGYVDTQVVAGEVVGNEVVDTSDATLVRSGAGTNASPYKLALNLNNANNWTANQYFNNKVGIGTLSPQDALEVYGAIKSTTIITGTNQHLLLMPNGTGNVGINTTAPSYKLDVNGTARFVGNVTVPAPTSDFHAATKKYVDDQVVAGEVIGNEVVDAADATLTRSGVGTNVSPYKLVLNLGNANTWTAVQTFNGGAVVPAPTLDSQAATKKYVDDTVAASGDTVVGNEITNVTNATLVRSGAGTGGDLYTVALNLGNANTWAVNQYFSGSIGIGTTSPDLLLNAVKSNASAGIGIDTYDDGTTASALTLRKSNTDTIGTQQQTIDTQVLGNILFEGVNTGSSFGYGGVIKASQVGGAGASYIPTKLQIYTYSGTGANPGITIDSAGKIGVNTTAPSASFEVYGTMKSSSIITGTNQHLLLMPNGTGKVGIGNISPAYNLDVAGNGCFSGTVIVDTPTANMHAATKKYVDTQVVAGEVIGNEVLNATNATLTRSGSGTNVDPYTLALNLGSANIWTAAQTFNANTNFPGSGIWNTSGNVGIGTDPGSYKLNVSGNVNVSGTITGNVTGNVSGNAGTVTNGVYTTSDQTIVGTKTFASLEISGNDNAERIGTYGFFGRFQNNGDTMNGPAYYTYMSHNARHTNNGNTTVWTGYNACIDPAAVLLSGNGIDFMTGSANLGSETLSSVMTITNSGNVGIGTSAGSYKLNVNGDTNVSGTVTATSLYGTSLEISGNDSAERIGTYGFWGRFQNNGDTGNGPAYYTYISHNARHTNNGNTTVWTGYNACIDPAAVLLSGNGIDFMTGSANLGSETLSSVMTITNSGNVGIGTSPGSYKLNVNGNTNVSGNLNATGNATVTGSVTAGSLSASGNISASGKLQENGHDLLPAGSIIMWSGSVASIPSGWALCNGANGTPDLRDRFIVGAGSSYSVGGVGGNVTHTHTYNGTVGNPDKTCTLDVGTAGSATPIDHKHGFSFTTTENNNTVPPYYALCFIMKL
ncbi:MAG: hypothetical protein LHV68_02330 [Elusimicrobia bacterium]|nr:hypothetical protein [Candidatus Liberimonas magnetica]